MWKFQDFSATQILRETNFGKCRSSKHAILTVLEALNFDFWKNFIVVNIKSYKNSKFRAAQYGQNGSF